MTPKNTNEPLRILHAFADYGVEDAVLSQFGSVTRASIEPRVFELHDE